MESRLKRIPRFETEEQERAFWEDPANDSTEYVEWEESKIAQFSKLRPSAEKKLQRAQIDNAE